MSLFVCAKCGCVDNTATSSYWMLTNEYMVDKFDYAKGLQPYKGMGLCSECGRLATSPDGRDVVVPGKWHGKFPKEKATEEQLKKTRKDRQSFLCPQHCRVDFTDGTITVPKAKDIPAVLHRKFKGTVKTVTVSMTPSGKYYASVLVDTSMQEIQPLEPVLRTSLGIDLGIKSLAVCSDGRTFENPKNLQKNLDRLAVLQKRLSRKRKGSENRNKARVKVARLQERIANCRRDNLHKITHALTHDNQVRTICMEDLNVKGMQRNHHLAGSVGDASFGMFLTLLEYKCRWYGVNLVKIDRFAPSSKTCRKCGCVYKGLKLSERSWTCPECGAHHDRDFNAACNIKEFGLKALPTERGKVKPVDCPLVDDRPRVLKSNGRKKQEKRGGIGISEAAKSLA